MHTRSGHLKKFIIFSFLSISIMLYKSIDPLIREIFYLQSSFTPRNFSLPGDHKFYSILIEKKSYAVVMLSSCACEMNHGMDQLLHWCGWYNALVIMSYDNSVALCVFRSVNTTEYFIINVIWCICFINRSLIQFRNLYGLIQ